MGNRYAIRDKADNRLMTDAIKHTKRRKPKGKSTDVDFDATAKAKFDANDDAIFGKKEPPHGGE